MLIFYKSTIFYLSSVKQASSSACKAWFFCLLFVLFLREIDDNNSVQVIRKIFLVSINYYLSESSLRKLDSSFSFPVPVSLSVCFCVFFFRIISSIDIICSVYSSVYRLRKKFRSQKKKKKRKKSLNLFNDNHRNRESSKKKAQRLKGSEASKQIPGMLIVI